MDKSFRSLPRLGILILWLLVVTLVLSGCFAQPDRTMDPLTVDLLTPQPLPLGTAQPLGTPPPVPSTAPTQPAPVTTQQGGAQVSLGVQGGNSGGWEDWGNMGAVQNPNQQTQGGQTATQTAAPRPASTDSWQTSTTDYNAGYPVLKLGSDGSDVYDMQERLKELGYYTGALDGKFASGTQSAVMSFQQSNGLSADGIAGRATQDKLYSSSAAVARVQVSSGSKSSSSSSLLKVGSQGTAVRKLQVRLAELGYYSGGADGIYGSSTENAVKTFQRSNGLSGDGQAGDQTIKKVYSDSAKSASRPVATADPNAKRALSIGMEGNDVYSMQKRLIELGYLNGVADGVFGSETQAALLAFQKNNNLTADGLAGLSTLKKLSGNAKAAPKSPTATPTPKPGSFAVLREGDAGEYVYDLQERLYDLGFYSGRIDGRFGEGTTAAVYAFQQAHGLAADGIAGAATQKKLFSSGAQINPGILSTPRPSSATPTPPPLENYTVLQEGGSGSSVKRLQQYLFDLGYYDGRVDGAYGASTTKAVRLFQYYNRLTEDGVAGPSTQALLYSGNAVFLPSSAATPTPNTIIVLQEGSTGDAVRQMQSRLYLLRYLEQANITGTFDAVTTEAVMTFQQRNGLTADGVAGPATLETMYDHNAEGLDPASID